MDERDREHLRVKAIEETITRCVQKLILPGQRALFNSLIERVEDLEADRRALVQTVLRLGGAKEKIWLKSHLSRGGRMEVIEAAAGGNGDEE